MASQKLRLIGAWYSPFVYRVELALKLKGVEYEVIEEQLQNKSPLLLESNPIFKKIPVLIHNGRPVVESLQIIEYIDEVWNQNDQIVPLDPHDRAIARIFAKFIDEKLNEPIKRIVSSNGEEQEKLVKKAKEAMEVIEGKLKGKKEKLFGGDKIGLVDLVMSMMAIWLEVVEEVCCVKIFEVQKFPHLYKWKQNFLESPLIKPTIPPLDKLRLFFTEFRHARLARL